MRRNKKVYWIAVGDIQDIAKGDLNRKLTEEELIKVIDKMGDFINWSDGVLDSFMELGFKEAEEKV
jgi:hypothetical protein